MNPSQVGQLEIQTQRRVINFFQDALGYEYLGYWEDCTGNANIEETLLRRRLEGEGHSKK